MTWHASKQVTSPPWNGRRLVHSKEMVWASRWSVALRTFYRQILSLLYSSFFFWNFRPRLARELLVISMYFQLNPRTCKGTMTQGGLQGWRCIGSHSRCMNRSLNLKIGWVNFGFILLKLLGNYLENFTLAVVSSSNWSFNSYKCCLFSLHQIVPRDKLPSRSKSLWNKPSHLCKETLEDYPIMANQPTPPNVPLRNKGLIRPY